MVKYKSKCLLIWSQNELFANVYLVEIIKSIIILLIAI